MSWLREFKEFAMRGNVVDLAVGVIMGAAFGKIVSSLVADILMPPIGALVGGVKFTELSLHIIPGVTINYGNFLQATFDFVIVAFCIFLLVKGMNALHKAPPPDPTEKECPYCLSKIPIKATKCAHCTSELPAQQSG